MGGDARVCGGQVGAVTAAEGDAVGAVVRHQGHAAFDVELRVVVPSGLRIADSVAGKDQLG